MRKLLLIAIIAAWGTSAVANLIIGTTGNVAVAIQSITITPSSYYAGSPDGTVVGAVAVQMSPNAPAFTGNLSLSPGTTKFRLSSTTLPANLLLNGVGTAGATIVPITAAQTGVSNSPYTQNVTINGIPQTITGVGLSGTSFPGGSSGGTAIGQVSVPMFPTTPAFSGTLALSGTDAARFQLSSASLPSTLQLNGSQPQGNYSVTVTATQAGATGSPFAQSFTITGTGPGLTTFTFVNNSGGTLPIGTPISFGEVFAYGDIMPGTHPLIRDASTHVALTHQQWNEISTWRENGGNGSWRHAVWAINLPNALASGATYQIEFIPVSGAYSQSPVLAPSALCSGVNTHALKIHLTDVRNQDDTTRRSGDATFDLCANIPGSGRDAVRILDQGSVVTTMKVVGRFQYTDTTYDPLLYEECDVSLWVDPNTGNSLKDTSWVCWVHNSWMTVAAGTTGHAGNPGPAGLANDPQAISYRPEVLDDPAPSSQTISAVGLTNSTYTSSVAGTVVGNITTIGTNDGATTFALSGPDAARFQLSSPCTVASCSLQASGSEPDGFHDGKFLVFITPTLAGARGSGIVYPFTINETVACNQTVANGGTQADIASAITAAPTNGVVCFADGGAFTLASAVTIPKAVRLTGVNAKVAPAITQTSGFVMFNPTAGGVKIDHLKATGFNALNNNNNCTGAGFVSNTGSINGLTIIYDVLDTFGCAAQLNTVANFIGEYNYIHNISYGGFVCAPCTTTSTISNNMIFDIALAFPVSQNSYPIVMSGSGAVSSNVTVQNNAVINNHTWECYDAHQGTNISFLSNYALSCSAGNTFFNMPANGGSGLVSPIINSNVIDRGTTAISGENSIVMGAFGGSLTCTTGCTINNNIIRFDGSSSYIASDDGVTLSGNTLGTPATMAAPTLTTDQPANGFVAGQANGVIGKINVVMSQAFPTWVGGWPNYGGWPGTFSIGGTDATQFQICVDGQHVCQKPGGTPAGTYNITLTGTLNELINSPQTSGTITLTGTPLNNVVLDWNGLDATVASSSNPILTSGCGVAWNGVTPVPNCLNIPSSTGLNSWYTGTGVRVTSTGTPAGGLSNGQFAWVYNVGSTSFSCTHTNQVSLIDGPAAINGTQLLTSSQGSGNTTFSWRVWHTVRTSWATLNEAMDENWSPGGSATRVTREVLPALTTAELRYWEQSGVVLPLQVAGQNTTYSTPCGFQRRQQLSSPLPHQCYRRQRHWRSA